MNENASPDKNGAPASSPSGRAPFWAAVSLLLLIAVLSVYIVWGQWVEAEAARAALAAQRQAQENLNGQLAAEAAMLRESLKKDPCLALELLKSTEKISPPTVGGGVPAAEKSSAPGHGEPVGGVSEKQPAPAGEQAGEPAAPVEEPGGQRDKTTPAPSKKPESVSELLEQATVLILASQRSGVGMGSGFFISPGVIMTNRHVVGEPDARIFVINKALGTVVSGKVTAFSDKSRYDFAVITLEKPFSVPVLSFNTNVRRTDRISAWGFPGMLAASDPKFQKLLEGDMTAVPEVIYTEGVVSVILDQKPPLIVHTATVSQGNSGGPLIDGNGRVVGVNTYIQTDGESYRQTNMAIKSQDILDFLKARGIPYTLDNSKPAQGK